MNFGQYGNRQFVACIVQIQTSPKRQECAGMGMEKNRGTPYKPSIIK